MIGLVVLWGALLVAVSLSLALGARDLPLREVLDVLLAPADTEASRIVHGLRVPRTLAAVAVGAALGAAGALIQALTRNPLADPGILGVNAGAACFVAIAVAAFGVTSIGGYVWFALAGALLVTVLVYLIGAAGIGAIDPSRLTLAGVATGAVLTGAVSAIVLIDPQAFDRMRSWNAGSVVGRDLGTVLPVLPVLGAGVLIAVLVASPLNGVALGDDLARSLGINVTAIRIAVVTAVTLLAGGATAVAGPIVFVGLMVPHACRWIVGPDQRWILAYSLLAGPVLMVAADVLGRIVMRPGEIPVGIMTAFLGAPVLIWLARRPRSSTP